MSEEVVEQITKTPVTESQTPNKEKDPEKVAAEKKLAEYNKKAKEALSRERRSTNLKKLIRIHLEKEKVRQSPANGNLSL